MKAWAQHVLLAAVATALGVVVAIAAIEIGVRRAGHRPWAFEPGTALGPTIVFERHPTFGWWPKPGSFIIPPYDWSGPVRITIRPDRARDTGAPLEVPPDLVTIGCSFTFGWGVSDDETYASRLQQKHPEWHVMNLGTPGYGTYQSLLRLEALLDLGVQPTRVLYGYIQGHEHRNIAHPYWTYSLEKYSTQGMVAVPFPTIDGGGRLVRHAPAPYPALPLRNYLASAVLLELRGGTWLARDRIEKQAETTDLIILELAELCRAHNIDFEVVLLTAEPAVRDHYTRLVNAHDIRMIDCSLTLTMDLAVPHDGHPNARAHGLYADCIDRALTSASR